MKCFFSAFGGNFSSLEQRIFDLSLWCGKKFLCVRHWNFQQIIPVCGVHEHWNFNFRESWNKLEIVCLSYTRHEPKFQVKPTHPLARFVASPSIHTITEAPVIHREIIIHLDQHSSGPAFIERNPFTNICCIHCAIRIRRDVCSSGSFRSHCAIQVHRVSGSSIVIVLIVCFPMALFGSSICSNTVSD